MSDKKLVKVKQNQSALVQMAGRLSIDPVRLKEVLKATAFAECKNDEQFAVALMVANKYGLNPLTKEIYAFPTQGGKVVPIVGLDGWIKLANTNKRFNGVELIENENNEGELLSVTAKFYLKDIDHPVVITEYMDECADKAKVPWQRWPRRMLRNKAYIQGARVAFGLSGIYDEDEAERIIEAEAMESVSMKPEVAEPVSLSGSGANENITYTDAENDAIEPEELFDSKSKPKKR